MSINLQIVSCLFLLTIISIIIYILRKGRISVKYSLVWLLATMTLLLLLIFPRLFSWLTKMLGFSLGSNMVFAGLIAMLMVINIVLTVIVSGQNEKIRLLIQEISILKEKLR